jgi:cell wall assembly regulator SMI1
VSAEQDPFITIPREVAKTFAEHMADATIEDPLWEHSTCLEFDALRQLLEAFARAGVPYSAEAKEFQRAGHAKSYVCTGDHAVPPARSAHGPTT